MSVIPLKYDTKIKFTKGLNAFTKCFLVEKSFDSVFEPRPQICVLEKANDQDSLRTFIRVMFVIWKFQNVDSQVNTKTAIIVLPKIIPKDIAGMSTIIGLHHPAASRKVAQTNKEMHLVCTWIYTSTLTLHLNLHFCTYSAVGFKRKDKDILRVWSIMHLCFWQSKIDIGGFFLLYLSK